MQKLLRHASLIALLGGCAAGVPYENRLQQWVGQPLDALVLAWGPPQYSYTLSDGRKIIEYREQQLIRRPDRSMLRHSRVFYLLDEMEDDYRLLQCRTRFTADQQGTIQQWAWDGNRY